MEGMEGIVGVEDSVFVFCVVVVVAATGGKMGKE